MSPCQPVLLLQYFSVISSGIVIKDSKGDAQIWDRKFDHNIYTEYWLYYVIVFMIVNNVEPIANE